MIIKEEAKDLKNMKVLRIPRELVDGDSSGIDLSKLGLVRGGVEKTFVREINESSKDEITKIIDGLIPEEHKDKIVIIDLSQEY